METRNSQREHREPIEQTNVYFARANKMWLEVNHSTSVTSKE